MTDDLVKRLRNAKESGDPWEAHYLATEAADRIEALEAAQGRLVAALRVNMMRLSSASHEDIDALIRAALEGGKKND